MPKATRRRFWRQFSLKTMFLFVTVLAVPLAWLGLELAEKRKENAARATFQALGAHVTYDYEYHGREPPGPALLRRLLGTNHYAKVVSIAGWPRELDNERLARLEDLPDVEDLVFIDVDLTDVGVGYIALLPRLNRLSITNADVTDAAAARLASMQTLETLDLNGTRITDAALAQLATLPNLRYLSVGNTSIGDTGLVHLRRLTKLERLDVYHTQVTREGVAKLRTFLPNCMIITFTVTDPEDRAF